MASRPTDLYVITSTFLRFFTFFQIKKNVTFYVFCRVSYVFSNYGVYERSAVFPNILRITVRYSASHVSPGHAYTRELAAARLVARCYQPNTYLKNDYGYYATLITTVYYTFLYNICTQAYVNLRKIYLNLEN